MTMKLSKTTRRGRLLEIARELCLNQCWLTFYEVYRCWRIQNAYHDSPIHVSLFKSARRGSLGPTSLFLYLSRPLSFSISLALSLSLSPSLFLCLSCPLSFSVSLALSLSLSLSPSLFLRLSRPSLFLSLSFSIYLALSL